MRKYMKISTALLMALIASSLFLSINGVQSADENQADVIRLFLRSAYLSSPIEVGNVKCRQISLTGIIKGEEGSGRLVLDPNSCFLNSFGDTKVCSKVFPPTIEVKFRRLQDQDPEGLGRMLFSVTDDNLPKTFCLVVPTNEKASYRFVLGPEDRAQDVVTLEPSRPF
jgi:hypothetical protein